MGIIYGGRIGESSEAGLETSDSRLAKVKAKLVAS